MTLTILVIDDNPSIRVMMQRMLEAEEFSVLTAANGREGVDLFKEHRPGLVITDIIMPDQEGIETIIQIRQHEPTAKIIAISGGGRIRGGELLRFARHLGANDTLAKPFGHQELLSVVRSVLG